MKLAPILKFKIKNKSTKSELDIDNIYECHSEFIQKYKNQFDILIQIFKPLVFDMVEDKMKSGVPYDFNGIDYIELCFYKEVVLIRISPKDLYENSYLYGKKINTYDSSWNPYLFSIYKKYPIKINKTTTDGVIITVDPVKNRNKIITEVLQ